MFQFVINSELLDSYKYSVEIAQRPVGHSKYVRDLCKDLYSFFSRHSNLMCDFQAKDCKTIKFLVSIRTDTTNEIIVPDNGLFYTDCTSSYNDELPMDDATILSAKKLVDTLFDCGEHLVKFIPRTTLYPVGACVVGDEPYVYVNVVIDATLKEEENFKLRNCHFEKIQDLSPKSALEKSLIDSLIIVK